MSSILQQIEDLSQAVLSGQNKGEQGQVSDFAAFLSFFLTASFQSSRMSQVSFYKMSLMIKWQPVFIKDRG